MKKSLITTVLFLATCTVLNADASNVVMDYQGLDTVVRPTGVERNLVINSDDNTRYDIAIRPLEDALISTDGKVEIPLKYVYFNNTHEDVYLRYNEYSNLFRNVVMGGIPKNLTAKIRDYGMVPAGVYNLNFEIQGTDLDSGNIASMTTFNLQFVVPAAQHISLHGEVPTIRISPEDAFKVNKKIPNETSPMIHIDSNTDWILTVTKREDNNKENYYIRTISASDKVCERLQERALLQEGKEIILARGKAPSNHEFITVEFSAEGKDGEIIRAGNYETNIRYLLKEDRGRI